MFGTGWHYFIWSKPIAQPGQEPYLCHMNAALMLCCCKCDVEWHVGSAQVRKPFFSLSISKLDNEEDLTCKARRPLKRCPLKNLHDVPLFFDSDSVFIRIWLFLCLNIKFSIYFLISISEFPLLVRELIFILFFVVCSCCLEWYYVQLLWYFGEKEILLPTDPFEKWGIGRGKQTYFLRVALLVSSIQIFLFFLYFPYSFIYRKFK